MKTYLTFFTCLFFILIPHLVSANIAGKDSIPMKVDENSEYFTLIQKGIAGIMENKAKDGIALLNEGIEMKNKIDNKNRIFEYFEFEFSSLIAYMDSKNIKPDEFEIGVTFLKEVFMSDKQKIHPEFITTLSAYVKKHPKSEFALRMEIYCMDNEKLVLLDKRLTNLLKMNPSLIAPNLYEGKIQFYTQHFKEAIPFFNNILKVFPEYALVYRFRGICFQNLNDSKSALDDFNNAIRLYPAYNDAFNNRGLLKSQMNKKDEAIVDFRSAININPNNEWPYNYIGMIYAYKNQTDSALFYFQEALDVNPNFEQAYENMGSLYYSKQDYGEAIHYFTKCIGLNAENTTYYSDRGDAYYFDDKKEQALADYQKGLEIDKKNPYLLMRIGEYYEFQKEYEKAIEYYDKSVSSQPNFKFAYVDMGLCYNFMKKNNEAKDALLKAIKIDSTYSIALGNLGWIYYCLGDFNKCILYSGRAIHYRADSYYAMFNIALATLRLGKFEESKLLYKQYVNIVRKSGEKVSEGAKDDLNDLIKQNIMVDQAGYILKNIFEKNE